MADGPAVGEAEARAAAFEAGTIRVYRTNVWFTTQPIEEPEPRSHLAETIEWIGWDRVLFATDYPHWDFDDPAQALPIKLTDLQRQQVFLENAKAVYRQM